MHRFSVWAGAGLLAVGVFGGVLTSAGAALADTGSVAVSEHRSGARIAKAVTGKADSTGSASTTFGSKATQSDPVNTSVSSAAPPKRKTKTPAVSSPAPSQTRRYTAVQRTARNQEPSTSYRVTPKPAATTVAVVPTASAVTKFVPAHVLSVAAEPAADTPVTSASNSITGIVQAATKFVTNVVNNVGLVALNALQAVEALITGPPVLPAGSTVTVRTSTILLGNGQRVQANWYYPDTDEPPTQMILLQHGLLALGPMYSFTAANLAENTNSIVVTPTLPTNPFAGDDHWLGGTAMASEIADLFVGDREALTDSAIAAGYAARYGLDPATAILPQKFALAGHSLGANLVSAAAGFLAENGAAANLVGVILYDGVPTGTTLSDALAKLAAFQQKAGVYIPVREIGAPLNFLNSTSTVNQTLTAARPDRFNGVVLSGGVHMDSMLGGNSLIQFLAYLVAGFPQAQNPPAVQDLSAQWLTDWFNGDTTDGDDLVPGTVIDIDTPKGIAHGRVIGTAPVTTSAGIAV
jgi:pimeloyl-ACP methyl ester carboxylesterase